MYEMHVFDAFFTLAFEVKYLSGNLIMGCNEFDLKVHVPVYKDRTKETTATLFDDKNEVRHSNSSLVHNQRQTHAFLIKGSFIYLSIPFCTQVI